MEFNRKLILDNGTVLYGRGFGAAKEAVCELVFNTSTVGYQELVSDPGYTDQAVVMSYPLIGNYGMTDEDFESRSPLIGALIVREYNDQPSNFRYTRTLSEYMEEHGIPGIEGIDTRRLIRMIRDGACHTAVLTDCSADDEAAMERLRAFRLPRDGARRVSCRKKWYSRTSNPKFRVTVIDCGVKQNIIRLLNQKGCNVTVVPCTSGAEEILAMRPDGVVFSNGPGSPEDLPEVIGLAKVLRGRLPLFGIDLGHEILALAYGARVVRLPFGAGGDLPVRNIETGKIKITAQTNCYAVDRASLEGTGLTLTHENVLDHGCAGLACRADRMISVQFHPESAPGPQDSEGLFDTFLQMMSEKGE